MRKKFSYIMIFFGIMIMIYPSLGKFYIEYEQKKLIGNSFENYQYEDLQKNLEDLQSEEVQVSEENKEQNLNILQDNIQTDSLDNNNNNNNNNNKVESETKNNDEFLAKFKDKNFLGIISIPKIEVKLPMLEGTSKYILSKSIGHLSNTPKPGQFGNASFAGHRSHTFAKFFNRLDEVEIGDFIYLKLENGEEKYIVYDKFVVKPTDVWVLKNTPNKKTITLITCHPLYSSKQRLIVKAEEIVD